MLDPDHPVAEDRADPGLLARVRQRPIRVVIADLDRFQQRLWAADRDLGELRVVRTNVVRVAQGQHLPIERTQSRLDCAAGCSPCLSMP
jgi:hypothetical protein